MMLLPKTIGPLTLTHKIGSGGVAESYEGTLAGPEKKRVIVRRILPYILQDRARLTSVEARVKDLAGAQHPFLLSVIDWIEAGEERFIVEEWTDQVGLDQVLAHAKSQNRPIPDNVFLNIAAQVCNGLEALHGRPGKGTGSENILHLGLRPASLSVDSEGKVRLGASALLRSPLALPGGGDGPVPMRLEYLSPEQTHSAQKLTPASDIFSLGTVLYELFVLDTLFKGSTKEEIIQQIRRAEVTSQLLKIKEKMPGLDKILFRALSVNPRHRYQRAFVLREDLRGLMANYSFSNISRDSSLYLSPLFAAKNKTDTQLLSDGPPISAAAGFQDSATRIDPDPTSTAAYAAKAMQERALKEMDSFADEWGDEKATEVKEMPPILDPPSQVSVLDQDSEEISLLPESESLELDSIDDSIDTDLSLGSVFPPGGAESTLGFVTSPNNTNPDRQASDPEELSGPTRSPYSDPQQGQAPAAARSAPTQFEDLREEPKGPKEAPASASEPPPFEPPAPARSQTAPPPAAANTPVFPDIGDDWGDGLDEGEEKKKSANPAGMAIAGFVAAAVILLGLKASLQPKDGEGESVEAGPTIAAVVEPIDEPEAEALEDVELEEKEAEPEPEPEPEPVVQTPRRSRRNSYTPPAENYDAVAYYPPTEPVEEEDDGPEERLRTDVSMYLAMAESGHLTRDHVYELETIGTDDDSYTQSRSLLLMNAEQSRKARDVKKYLDQLFILDENRYNPVFLSKRARWFANNGKYDRALADAQKAEQHWARIPPNLVFPTKTEIFEVQASSLQGLFYKSEDDVDLLDKAIRGWKKYKRHVASRRSDLGEHAEAQIRKLDYARSRLR